MTGQIEQYLAHELAALKAQSTEQPVAWYCEAPAKDWDLYNSDEREVVVYSESEMRDALENDFTVTPLYAHPPQASEPVAYAVCDTQDSTAIHSVHIFKDEAERHQFGLGSVVPIYLAPPQAEALVADFKRRAVEECRKSDRHRGDYFAKLVDSMPLINDFNQGEK